MAKLNQRSRLTITLAALAAAVFAAASAAAETDAWTAKATEVIDRDVFNEQGEAIAETDDLVIRRNGRIKRVTMEVGGFLDIGDKIIALPLKMVQITEAGVVVGLSQAQLEKKEAFEYIEQGLNPAYYYYPPRALRGPYPRYHRQPPPMYRDTPYPRVQTPYPDEVTYFPGRFLASVALDRPLMNKDQRTIGATRDLILDLAGHRVVEIIVALDADAVGKEGYVSLPYEQLGFRFDGLVYDIGISDVRDLPLKEYSEE